MTAFLSANLTSDRKKSILAKVGFDANGGVFVNAVK